MRKIREGRVVSTAMQKSITVLEERMVLHPVYKKRIKKLKKFIVHDEDEKANVGDRVRIEETRPISKRKKWRLIAILEEAKR